MNQLSNQLVARFRKNGTLKLLSLLLAVTLVSVTQDDRVTVREVEVPFSVTILEANRVPIKRPPDSVKVTLSGTDPALRRLKEPRIEPISVELTGRQNEEWIRLDRRNIKGVPAKWVKKIDPEKQYIKLEPIIVRSIPVVLKLEGEPKGGFRLRESSVEPTSVDVSGPQSVVKDLKEMRTRPISLVGRSSATSTEVELESPPYGTTLEADKQSVLVKLDILENREQRVFPDMEIALLTGDESELATASPSAVDVVVEGPISQIRKLDRKSIDVYIDPDDVPLGRSRRKQMVADAPAGTDIEIVQFTPPTVLVTRKRKPTPSVPKDLESDMAQGQDEGDNQLDLE
ncbi:MAG: CdaR family protein [Myxococcota bacterium]|nr:CdaR family protein [Myxococcota bacterium]